MMKSKYENILAIVISVILVVSIILISFLSESSEKETYQKSNTEFQFSISECNDLLFSDSDHGIASIT